MLHIYLKGYLTLFKSNIDSNAFVNENYSDATHEQQLAVVTLQGDNSVHLNEVE